MKLRTQTQRVVNVTAVFMGRRVQVRPDLAYAIQVCDRFNLMPERCDFDMAVLVSKASEFAIPYTIAYSFPYARSPRSQIRWPVASARVTIPIADIKIQT